jgi:hypothetical protein
MEQASGPLRAFAPSARVLFLFLLVSPPSLAEEPRHLSPKDQKAAAPDRFSVSGSSETIVQLYRRALIPGQNGQFVPTEVALPVHEYLFANARDVDTPWQKDSLGIEFAAWGRYWPTASNLERPFDGDVQTANVRLEAGPTWARLGRQQIAGGAARYARFDGVMVGARHLAFYFEGYAGFTVLPRWNGRLGYYQLGAAENTLLTYFPPAPQGGEHWLAGARLGYQTSHISGSLSFHNQEMTGGVDRRNVGLDLGAQPIDDVSLGASALLDVDGGRFANARLWADAAPHPLIDVSAEVLHSEPSLLLSRQSVLSVFTTDGYDELGGTLTAKVLRWLRLDTNGFLEAYSGTGPGARGEAAARIALGREYPTLLRVAYSRVIAPRNGYQALRVSFSRKLGRRLSSTLEAYGYFYDMPVAGRETSSVYAGTASYQAHDLLELLWSASVAQSPYAAFDAQTMLRATYQFDAAARPKQR